MLSVHTKGCRYIHRLSVFTGLYRPRIHYVDMLTDYVKMMWKAVFVVCVNLLVLFELCCASNILFMPMGHKSHVNFFSVSARVLQDRGHIVQVLAPQTMKTLADKVNVTTITYDLPHNMNTEKQFEEAIASPGKQSIIEILANVTNKYNVLCDIMNEDHRLITQLENAHYDLVIIDGFDIARCMYSIPYRIGVRYISLNARHDPWNAGVHVMPSVETLMGFGNDIDSDSSMWERVKSLAAYWMFWYNLPSSALDETILLRHNPTKPSTTFLELYQNSEMWFINIDTVCLDFPRMHGLHYQFLPGIGLQEASPLPEDLDDFVQGSRKGVVVLALGSALKKIPATMLQKMLHAFAQVEYRIVMRHDSDGSEKAPANVKMMSWLPQNDLLSHPKTKVFIGHGGNNGQLESMYHGVPMITIPYVGDQHYNAMRVQKKKFGVTLNKDTFTSDELVQAINDLAKPKPFRENIRKCAEKYRSLSSPHDTLNFWVDHIIQFGGEYLKPATLKMPLWKVFMLDVLLILLIVMLVIYTIVLLVVRNLCTRCKGGRGDLSKKTL